MLSGERPLPAAARLPLPLAGEGKANLRDFPLSRTRERVAKGRERALK